MREFPFLLFTTIANVDLVACGWPLVASYIIPNRPFSRWPGNPCRWCILLLVSTCITCIRNPRFYITRGDGRKYPSGLTFDHFLGKPKEKRKKKKKKRKQQRKAKQEREIGQILSQDGLGGKSRVV